MVERLLCKQDVVGSTPSGSTIFLWAIAAERLLEPQRDWLSRSYRFAADLRIGCIDIVKEEFDRPLIGFQVRFEKTSSGK